MKNLLIGFLFIIFSFTACKTDDTSVSKFKSVIPTSNMIKLDIPENVTNKVLGDTAENYLTTVRITKGVNDSVLQWLAFVNTITDYPPSDETDNNAVWGPWTPDGLSSVEYRFVINKNGDGSFDYSMEMKPKGGNDDEFVAVYTGHINSNPTVEVNSGTMSFDFDAAANLDTSIVSQGKISVVYSYDNGAKDIGLNFDEFAERANDTPVTAEYHYISDASGQGTFDFETWMNIHEGEDAVTYPESEHLMYRSRWTADGNGRSDVTVDGTELTAQGISDYKMSECWNTSFISTYINEIITTSDNQTSENPKGDPTSCSPFTDFSSPDLKK